MLIYPTFVQAAQDATVTYLCVENLRKRCAEHRQAAKKADEEAAKSKADYEVLLAEKVVVDRRVNELTIALDSKAQELAKCEENLKSMSEAKTQLQEEYEDALATCVLKERLVLFEELYAGKHFDYAAQIEELKYEIAAGEVSDEEH